MSGVEVYRSDKLLILRADKPSGLELYAKKSDVAGNQYYAWVGLVEEHSAYAAFIQQLSEEAKK